MWAFCWWGVSREKGIEMEHEYLGPYEHITCLLTYFCVWDMWATTFTCTAQSIYSITQPYSGLHSACWCKEKHGSGSLPRPGMGLTVYVVLLAVSPQAHEDENEQDEHHDTQNAAHN